MPLAHPRPLRPHASSPLPGSTTSSASESLNSATQQSVSTPSEEAAPAVEKTGYPPQPYLVKPQQAEKENSPSSSSAPGGSSARPPHSPLTTNRRAFSAPYSQPLYVRPVSVAGPGAAVAEEPEEGRAEERVGGAWDREAVDELREIFSATSVSPAATTTTTTTTSSSSSFVRTTVLLPPRPPSSANGAHHHPSSSTSLSSFPHPPRTPSRATGRSSSSRNGHARRPSSASAGSASASSPAASATTASGSELGSLVSGMGVLRVKTPVRVVGWDGEYYSPPSRALTRNPFASLSHTHSHTPTTSFPLAPPGGLGALSQQLRKLHTHSAYPVMMEHAQGQVHEGAEGERHEEGEERGKEVSA